MMPLEDWPGRWGGRTVACIASGPSLTAEDCKLILLAGIPTIVTNSSFRIAPFADALMAMDAAWWNAHTAELGASGFTGERLTITAHQRHATSLHKAPWFRHFHNSGANAISLAISAGASRIILLGYDCSKDASGRMHWHKDHPSPMSNGRSIKTWPSKFAQVAEYATRKGARIVNCSRRTFLHFERMALEDGLALEHLPARAAP